MTDCSAFWIRGDLGFVVDDTLTCSAVGCHLGAREKNSLAERDHLKFQSAISNTEVTLA